MDRVAVGLPQVHRQRGKWVVRVDAYDPSTGRRRPHQLGTFERKRDAEAFVRNHGDGRVGTAEETVADFFRSSWLSSKEGRVEKNTLDQYRWAVDLHIVPLIGAVRLGDLTPELLDEWIAQLVAKGDDEKPRLGTTSARLVRKILSMGLQEAVDRGRLPRNPVALTEPPKRVRRTSVKGWTRDEAATFLRTAQAHRLYPAFLLGLVCGLRRGEILGLSWSDIDLAALQLHVQRQLATERGKPVLKQLKTEESDRWITFGEETASALKAHRTAQEEEAAFAGAAWSDSGLVFTTPLGGWIDPNNFARSMEALIEKAGVRRITPQGLRHTSQSVGRVVVGDDKVMQERLGHTDIEITLGTYTHVVTEQHREAGVRMDTAFHGKSSKPRRSRRQAA